MSAWSFLFSGAARAEHHRVRELEIEKLSAAHRDTVQLAKSASRVMTTMAGAMQLMAQEATDNAP